MKKLSDNEIQQLLDNGLSAKDKTISADDQAEVKTYSLLFDLLEEEQQEGFSYGFAQKVTRKIQAGVDRSISVKWYILAFAISCAAIAVTCGLLYTFGSHTGKQFSTLVINHKWVFVFVSAVILSVNYFDRKLKRTVI